VITLRALHIPTDWRWVKAHVDCVLCEDSKGIVAERDGETVGVVILDSWAPNSCQVHLGATTPLVWKHGLHKEVFRYVFEVCGREMILGLTPANNRTALRFNKHMGFRQTYVIKDGFAPGIDYIVHEMRRDECRWIENGPERTDQRTAAAG